MTEDRTARVLADVLAVALDDEPAETSRSVARIADRMAELLALAGYELTDTHRPEEGHQ